MSDKSFSRFFNKVLNIQYRIFRNYPPADQIVAQKIAHNLENEFMDSGKQYVKFNIRNGRYKFRGELWKTKRGYYLKYGGKRYKLTECQFRDLLREIFATAYFEGDGIRKKHGWVVFTVEIPEVEE